MRHLLGSLFAIALAAVAAIAATTAMLNTPSRSGAAVDAPPAAAQISPETPAAAKAPATAEGGPPPTPGEEADPKAPAAASGRAPADGAAVEEADKDPYEGIEPEELPPDLQYNADSSVSFPTNI